jgi:hypothetical protein
VAAAATDSTTTVGGPAGTIRPTRIEVPLPSDATTALEWCGTSARDLVVAGEHALYIVKVRTSDPAKRVTTVPADAPAQQLGCTDDGSTAYFLGKGRRSLLVLDMQTHEVATLAHSAEPLHVPPGHVVSGDGQFLLGAQEFPDSFSLPGKRSIRVIKVPNDPEHRRPRAAHWSPDSRHLFVYYSTHSQLLTLDTQGRVLRTQAVPALGERNFVSDVLPFTPAGEVAYLKVLESDVISRLYRWPDSEGTLPEPIASDIENEWLHVTPSGAVALCRSIFLNANRAAQRSVENWPIPDFYEIDALWHGRLISLDRLDPSSPTEPSLSDDDAAVAYVRPPQNGTPTPSTPSGKQLVVLLFP